LGRKTLKITTRTSLVGFLLAISALNVPTATAATEQAGTPVQQTIEERLTKLTAAIGERKSQLPDSALSEPEQRLARGWADGNGRDWVNGGRRGWADGHGGGWVNANPWRNGWADGGGFYNYRY
jgi:rSAM-associated Gly-rich repeat protein